MEFLITGALNGNGERLKGLLEVSGADISISLGPLNLKEPLILKRTWFYIHGKEKDYEVLSKSDGVDIMSRIFKYKGIFFSGLSGVYHPQTWKFTRQEWAKRNGGKFPKKDAGYIFAEDIAALFATFQKLRLERVQIFVSNLRPGNRIFEEIVRTIKPEYCLFPSDTFEKFKKNGTKFIGLEEAASFNGKYIIHFQEKEE
ncbi:hypothetical protein [Desulfurobacterium sp.]